MRSAMPLRPEPPAVSALPMPSSVMTTCASPATSRALTAAELALASVGGDLDRLRDDVEDGGIDGLGETILRQVDELDRKRGVHDRLERRPRHGP